MPKQNEKLLRPTDMTNQEVEAIIELSTNPRWKRVSEYLKRLHEDLLLTCEDPPKNLDERQLGQVQGKAKQLRFILAGMHVEARQTLERR